MPDCDSTAWNYGGEATISDMCKISVPPAVIEAGILSPGSRVYWSVLTASERVVLTNEELDSDEGITVAGTLCGDEAIDFDTIVPVQLFEESKSQSVTILGDPLPDHTPFAQADTLHFVFTDEMANGPSRACLVLKPGDFDAYESGDLPPDRLL